MTTYKYLLFLAYTDGSVKIYNLNTGKLGLVLNGSLFNTPTTIMRLETES